MHSESRGYIPRMRQLWRLLVWGALTACSSTTAIGLNSNLDAGSSVTDASTDSSADPTPEDASPQDAGCDATPESADPPGGCALTEACSDCTLSGQGYRCEVEAGVRKQPSSVAGNPMVGCRRSSMSTDTTNYCCPEATCVRTPAYAGCESPKYAIVCPVTEMFIPYAGKCLLRGGNGIVPGVVGVQACCSK